MLFLHFYYYRIILVNMIFPNNNKATFNQTITAFVILLFTIMGNTVFAQSYPKKETASTISPLDFGLQEAESDSARYEILYNTHLRAIQEGASVSYAGVDTLTIAVTQTSQPIPLTRHNDFRGAHLIVKNNVKTQYLFQLIDTSWRSIPMETVTADSGNFSSISDLASGMHLVVLEDEHPWVNNRTGYNYGARRKDILLIQNGRAQNRPISPYSTDSTLMKAKTHPTDGELKFISNLTIVRDTSSTYKTYCFNIIGINNLKINNITIKTPDTKNMYADAAINIENCTNITFEDVTIDGTYSRTSNYGYGILMNNVWNSQFSRLSAHANWGIFGTNNLSNTTLRNCDINRFDIHCYGRDVFIHNCTFRQLYNQFSSLFGTLLFDGCRFIEFIPVLIETSYNAYTPFDVRFKNCVIDAQPSRNYLISTGLLDNDINSRPELSQKCWPNVQISNMTVKVSNKISKVILFYPKGQVASNISVGNISDIFIDGLTFEYADTAHIADFVICNTFVSSKNPINYDLKNIKLIPSAKKMMRQASKKYAYPGSITFNLRHDKNDQVYISKSRLNYNVNTNSHYNIKYTNCEIGMIRYNSTVNGTRRLYNQCTLYLNNDDDARYYIDNQATYFKCTFIPCHSKLFISFYGTNNDVIIKNCKSTRKSKLFYQGRNDNAELRGYVIRGTEKYYH